MINLDAYFSRIAYTGTRAPTLATLIEIHRHHARAIPFENLDVLLGRGIRIDSASIEKKLIHDRRGGYCFEQNGLLREVLQALGYHVTPLIGRVRWQVPAESETALTHMILRVETEVGPHLCDVGFGSMALKLPLALQYDLEQNVSFEPRRVILRAASSPETPHGSGVVVHQARLGNEWLDVYQFSLESACSVDFELGNWFTSTHPQSRFKQNLIAARSDDGFRCTLINREFSIRHADGRVDKRTIETADELLSVLAEYFHLRLPAGTRFGSAGAAWPV
jgi:N-hydroxyarylamine O-acetyltransferase